MSSSEKAESVSSDQAPSILIIGVDGMIGSALAQEATRRGIPWQGTSRRPGAHWHLDLADPPEKWQLPEHADIAILCAAITQIEICESNLIETWKVNVESTIALADRLAQKGTQIVFLSTSRVFPPTYNEPSEDTAPAPSTQYGLQKLAVEEHLIGSLPSARVIRPTKVVSENLPLFFQWKQLLKDGKEINPYSNLYLSPISLGLMVKDIFNLINSKEAGIFHLSASNAISYLEAAKVLAQINGLNETLVSGRPALFSNTPGILKTNRPLKEIGIEPLTALENLRHAFCKRTAGAGIDKRIAASRES